MNRFICGVAALALAGFAGAANAQFQVTVQTVAGGGSDGDLNNINEGEALLANGGAAEGTAAPDIIDFSAGAFPAGTTPEQFALSAVGVVDIIGGSSLNGVVLYVNSDDGFRLRVNGTIVSEFNDPTGSSNTATGPLTLNDGDVISLTFFERDGGEFVRLRLNDDSGPFVGSTASGIDIVPVPEPASLGLLGLGGLGLIARRRRA